MNQPIELRKSRDFGQIINDSFAFFKENFKPLISYLFIITGLFLIASTATNIFYYLKIIDVYNPNPNEASIFSSFSSSYIFSVLLNGVVTGLTQAFIHLTALCYMSVYLQKGNKQPTFDEVWGYFKYYFLRVMGSGILIVLLMCVAFVACIIPFFYVMPIFYLILPIIVIENSSFKYAFNKSFKLIKDNWWFVFGVIFVMALIVGMAVGIASIPISVVTIGSKFFSLKGFTMPILIIFSALHSLVTLAYALLSIAICMCYFTLSEQKEGLGLLNRIENFGKVDKKRPQLASRRILSNMYRFIAIYYTLVITLFLFTTANAGTKKPVVKKLPAVLCTDTSTINVRKFNAAAINKFKADKAFNYNETPGPQDSLWDRFWAWVWNKLFGWIKFSTYGGKVIEWVVGALLVGLLVYVIAKISGIDSC